MKPSSNAIQLIKNREKCRLTSYKLPGEAHYTIGWGHYADRDKQFDRPNVKITQAQADALLYKDVEEKTKALSNYIKIPISQNLYDALVSTVYQYNPSNSGLKAIYRVINLGFPAEQIVSMFTSLPSNSYNKKARKADMILFTLGKVVHLETLKA